jgi:hypothetical protein
MHDKSIEMWHKMPLHMLLQEAYPVLLLTTEINQ